MLSFEESLHIPGYSILEMLGEGGFGAVFRARASGGTRDVAIKVLRDPNPKAQVRFQDEIRVHSQIQCPHLPAYLGAGKTPSGSIYLVMEFLTGETLEKALSRDRSPKATRALLAKALPGVVKALEALHRAQAVHRDLKPENISLRPGSNEGVLLDLGLVKQDFLPPKTRTGIVLGSPATMAPEQLEAKPKISPKTDLYQLAMLVLRALDGSFRDPGRSFLTEVLAPQGHAPRLGRYAKTFPEDPLIPGLEACLRRNPEDRPEFSKSAWSLCRALAASRESSEILTSSSAKTVALSAVSPEPSAVSLRESPGARRRRILGAGLALGMLVGGFGFFLSPATPESSGEPLAPSANQELRRFLDDFEFQKRRSSFEGQSDPEFLLARLDDLARDFQTQAKDRDLAPTLLALPQPKTFSELSTWYEWQELRRVLARAPIASKLEDLAEVLRPPSPEESLLSITPLKDAPEVFPEDPKNLDASLVQSLAQLSKRARFLRTPELIEVADYPFAETRVRDRALLGNPDSSDKVQLHAEFPEGAKFIGEVGLPEGISGYLTLRRADLYPPERLTLELPSKRRKPLSLIVLVHGIQPTHGIYLRFQIPDPDSGRDRYLQTVVPASLFQVPKTGLMDEVQPRTWHRIHSDVALFGEATRVTLRVRSVLFPRVRSVGFDAVAVELEP